MFLDFGDLEKTNKSIIGDLNLFATTHICIHTVLSTGRLSLSGLYNTARLPLGHMVLLDPPKLSSTPSQNRCCMSVSQCNLQLHDDVRLGRNDNNNGNNNYNNNLLLCVCMCVCCSRLVLQSQPIDERRG